MTPESINQAMADAVIERIRTAIAAKIMERLKPDVDAAVDSAMAALKVDAEVYRDAQHRGDVLRVLIDDRHVRAA